VSVEGLVHGDLSYEVSMGPIIVDETRYTTSAETVIVHGGDETATRVMLRAEPERGTLSGRVVDGSSGDGVEASLLVTNLVTGAARATSTADDGTFILENLPIAEHALLARSSNGFHLPQHVDFAGTSTVETRIHLIGAGTGVLKGVVTLDGDPLPFAQAVVNGLPIAHADPITGAFELAGVDGDGSIIVEITAAGCYGLKLDTTEHDLGEIPLALHAETEVIERGGSRLYVPSQSTIISDGDVIDLQRGVLWVGGMGSSEDMPVQIEVGDYALEGSGANFAVERVADVRARLYVSQGQVLVTHKDMSEPIYATTGQTLVLEGAPGRPVNLEPGSGAVLRSVAGSVAYFETAPSASEQLSVIVTQMVVIVAQVLMLLAFLITFLALPGMAVVIVVTYINRRRSYGTDRSHAGE
jgi:hypothetical protein